MAASALISTLLLFILLGIGAKRRLTSAFPMFYLYVGVVILSDLIRFVCRLYYSNLYLPVYWYTQFFCVAFGFGILWEIYGVIFRGFPGTARMAKFLVSFTFAIILLNALVQIIVIQPAGLSSVINLEKNMRLVQAMLLGLGITLVIYYEVPLGMNASGILFGYGGLVIAGIVLLSLRENFGTEFYEWWVAGRVVASRATLGVWLFTLHSYRPAPALGASAAMVEDYEVVAKATSASLARIKNSLGKALEQ